MSLRPSVKRASAVSLSLAVGSAEAERERSVTSAPMANAERFMAAADPSSNRAGTRERSTNRPFARTFGGEGRYLRLVLTVSSVAFFHFVQQSGQRHSITRFP